jgi:hypothetical protein
MEIALVAVVVLAIVVFFMLRKKPDDTSTDNTPQALAPRQPGRPTSDQAQARSAVDSSKQPAPADATGEEGAQAPHRPGAEEALGADTDTEVDLEAHGKDEACPPPPPTPAGGAAPPGPRGGGAQKPRRTPGGGKKKGNASCLG